MTNKIHRVKIIGGGLSGCEAALQLASAGVNVDLYEMRPKLQTPAHKTGGLAELVCSNSFKGLAHTSAHGLFKEELKRLGSKLIELAMENRIPAGESLAVDREKFSNAVETAVDKEERIQLIREEVHELNLDEYSIVAAGPLASSRLCQALYEKIQADRLYFFDSIAPVVESDSIDFNSAYFKNRWDKGITQDFVNCPLNAAEYGEFVEALRKADSSEQKPFEKNSLFEGCLPIEEMARRGEETLRYGPMRPVGLYHPVTNARPHAVLQLRKENESGTLFNLVGCQTRLKQKTQKEIFSIIPALKNAAFARYGAMHRNTFLNAPEVLSHGLRLKGTNIFFAGQITGAEGYTEAVATGLYSASMVYADLMGKTDFTWPEETCLGALVKHLLTPNPDFQPMNLNFGLFPRPANLKKAQKKDFIIKQCLDTLEKFIPHISPPN